MSADKCPNCGNAISLRWDREGSDRGIFECGSTIRAGEFTSSKHCQERVARQKAEAEASKLTDTLDLMRDEFQRILARCVEFDGITSTFTMEIKGLCNRSVSGIEQRVPVIEQRDKAEKRVRELGTELDDALKGVVAIRCTKHVAVPLVNRNASNEGECGACIADELAETRRKLDELDAVVRVYRDSALSRLSAAIVTGLISKLPLIDQEGKLGITVNDKIKYNSDVADSVVEMAKALMVRIEAEKGGGV